MIMNFEHQKTIIWMKLIRKMGQIEYFYPFFVCILRIINFEHQKTIISMELIRKIGRIEHFYPL